jgi:hypothetical protein
LGSSQRNESEEQACNGSGDDSDSVLFHGCSPQAGAAQLFSIPPKSI